MKFKGDVLLTLIMGCFFALGSPVGSKAQDAKKSVEDSVKVKETVSATPKKHWYETIALRGYAQVRYNRLLETNEKLKCEQCDKSWGEGGGFFLRRMRLIFSGNVHERVYIYIYNRILPLLPLQVIFILHK